VALDPRAARSSAPIAATDRPGVRPMLATFGGEARSAGGCGDRTDLRRVGVERSDRRKGAGLTRHRATCLLEVEAVRVGTGSHDGEQVLPPIRAVLGADPPPERVEVAAVRGAGVLSSEG
jgi:hypothetical protein